MRGRIQLMCGGMRRIFVAGMLILSQSLQAQGVLPSIRVPPLPAIGRPGTLGAAVPALTNELASRQLRDVRRLYVRNLVRRHRDALELDPGGAAIMRGEVLAFSPSDAAVAKARAAGFSVLRERTLDGLDGRIVVFEPPRGTSTRRALATLRSLDPSGSYEFNHIYTDSGTVIPAGASGTPTEPGDASQPAAAQAMPDPGEGTRLGLIDGGVPGLHFYVLNKSPATVRVLRAVKR